MKIIFKNGSIIEIIDSEDNVRSKRGEEQLNNTLKAIKRHRSNKKLKYNIKERV